MSLPESFLGDAPTPGPVAIPTPRDPVIVRLLALLEQAPVGSRALDEEIHFFLYKNLLPSGYPLDTLGNYRYSSSLDAALTLVPHDKMWFLGHMDPTDLRFAATISECGHVGVQTWRGIHEQAALALCVAAMKARDATSKAQG